MEQEFCQIYVAKMMLDLDLAAKMQTRALLSPKLAQSRYCYESSGLTEVHPNKKLVPLPDRFPIWSDLEVSGLLPTLQGTLPLSPSPQSNLKLWR